MTDGRESDFEWRCIGEVPSQVIDALWPGFEPHDRYVWVNPIHLRRHMQSHLAYLDRVALLNEIEPDMDTLLDRAIAYLRFDKVFSDQAGIDVVSTVPDGVTGEYVVLGVRLWAIGSCTRNFVATAFGWNAAKLERSLAGRAHWIP